MKQGGPSAEDAVPSAESNLFPVRLPHSPPPKADVPVGSSVRYGTDGMSFTLHSEVSRRQLHASGEPDDHPDKLSSELPSPPLISSRGSPQNYHKADREDDKQRSTPQPMPLGHDRAPLLLIGNIGGGPTSVPASANAAAAAEPAASHPSREQLWSYLFHNVNRAVDELYALCEAEGTEAHCAEAAKLLRSCGRDFAMLIERSQAQSRYEAALRDRTANEQTSRGDRSGHKSSSSSSGNRNGSTLASTSGNLRSGGQHDYPAGVAWEVRIPVNRDPIDLSGRDGRPPLSHNGSGDIEFYFNGTGSGSDHSSERGSFEHGQPTPAGGGSGSGGLGGSAFTAAPEPMGSMVIRRALEAMEDQARREKEEYFLNRGREDTLRGLSFAATAAAPNITSSSNNNSSSASGSAQLWHMPWKLGEASAAQVSKAAFSSTLHSELPKHATAADAASEVTSPSAAPRRTVEFDASSVIATTPHVATNASPTGSAAPSNGDDDDEACGDDDVELAAEAVWAEAEAWVEAEAEAEELAWERLQRADVPLAKLEADERQIEADRRCGSPAAGYDWLLSPKAMHDAANSSSANGSHSSSHGSNSSGEVLSDGVWTESSDSSEREAHSPTMFAAADAVSLQAQMPSPEVASSVRVGESSSTVDATTSSLIGPNYHSSVFKRIAGSDAPPNASVTAPPSSSSSSSSQPMDVLLMGFVMHEKLSSPDRAPRPSIEATRAKTEARHDVAARNREALEDLRRARVESQALKASRVHLKLGAQQSLAEESFAAKMSAGEERRAQHLAAIQVKAQNENAKVSEVLFINGLTADGIKDRLDSRLREVEARAAAARQRRQAQRAEARRVSTAKADAVAKVQAERKEQLAHKASERWERLQQRLEWVAERRLERLNELARRREDREERREERSFGELHRSKANRSNSGHSESSSSSSSSSSDQPDAFESSGFTFTSGGAAFPTTLLPLPGGGAATAPTTAMTSADEPSETIAPAAARKGAGMNAASDVGSENARSGGGPSSSSSSARPPMLRNSQSAKMEPSSSGAWRRVTFTSADAPLLPAVPLQAPLSSFSSRAAPSTHKKTTTSPRHAFGKHSAFSGSISTDSGYCDSGQTTSGRSRSSSGDVDGGNASQSAGAASSPSSAQARQSFALGNTSAFQRPGLLSKSRSLDEDGFSKSANLRSPSSSSGAFVAKQPEVRRIRSPVPLALPGSLAAASAEETAAACSSAIGRELRKRDSERGAAASRALELDDGAAEAEPSFEPIVAANHAAASHGSRQEANAESQQQPPIECNSSDSSSRNAKNGANAAGGGGSVATSAAAQPARDATKPPSKGEDNDDDDGVANRGKKLRKLRTKLLRSAPGWNEARWGSGPEASSSRQDSWDADGAQCSRSGHGRNALPASAAAAYEAAPRTIASRAVLNSAVRQRLDRCVEMMRRFRASTPGFEARSESGNATAAASNPPTSNADHPLPGISSISGGGEGGGKQGQSRKYAGAKGPTTSPFAVAAASSAVLRDEASLETALHDLSRLLLEPCPPGSTPAATTAAIGAFATNAASAPAAAAAPAPIVNNVTSPLRALAAPFAPPRLPPPPPPAQHHSLPSQPMLSAAAHQEQQGAALQRRLRETGGLELLLQFTAPRHAVFSARAAPLALDAMALVFGSATPAQRDFVLASDGGVGLVDAATWALNLCVATEAALANRTKQAGKMAATKARAHADATSYSLGGCSSSRNSSGSSSSSSDSRGGDGSGGGALRRAACSDSDKNESNSRKKTGKASSPLLNNGKKGDPITSLPGTPASSPPSPPPVQDGSPTMDVQSLEPRRSPKGSIGQGGGGSTPKGGLGRKQVDDQARAAAARVAAAQARASLRGGSGLEPSNSGGSSSSNGSSGSVAHRLAAFEPLGDSALHAAGANPWESLNGAILLLLHLVRHTANDDLLPAQEGTVRFLCVTGFVQQLLDLLAGREGLLPGRPPIAEVALAQGTHDSSLGGLGFSKSSSSRNSGSSSASSGRERDDSDRSSSGAAMTAASVAAAVRARYLLLTPLTAMTLLRRSVALLEAIAAFPRSGRASTKLDHGTHTPATPIGTLLPNSPYKDNSSSGSSGTRCSSNGSSSSSGKGRKRRSNSNNSNNSGQNAQNASSNNGSSSDSGASNERTVIAAGGCPTLSCLEAGCAGGRAFSAVRRLFVETKAAGLPHLLRSLVGDSAVKLALEKNHDEADNSRSSNLAASAAVKRPLNRDSGSGAGGNSAARIGDEILEVCGSALLCLSHITRLDLPLIQAALGGEPMPSSTSPSAAAAAAAAIPEDSTETTPAVAVSSLPASAAFQEAAHALFVAAAQRVTAAATSAAVAAAADAPSSPGGTRCAARSYSPAPGLRFSPAWACLRELVNLFGAAALGHSANRCALWRIATAAPGAPSSRNNDHRHGNTNNSRVPLGGSLVGRLLTLPSRFFADSCEEQHELFAALLALLPPPPVLEVEASGHVIEDAGSSDRVKNDVSILEDRGWRGLERAVPGLTAQLAAYLATQRANMRRDVSDWAAASSARTTGGSSRNSRSRATTGPKEHKTSKGSTMGPAEQIKSVKVVPAWVALSHRFPLEFWEEAAAQIAAATPDSADDHGSEAV